MKIAFGILAVAMLTIAPAVAETWRTYENGRFGTTINYPGRFRPTPPDATNSGREFVSADGASFSVWGSHNSLDENIEDAEKASRKRLRDEGVVLTYSARGVDWFVLSGTKSNKIIYLREKVTNRESDMHGFQIEYPSRLEKAYDPIVTRMSRSFTARPSSLATPAMADSLPAAFVGNWCSVETGTSGPVGTSGKYIRCSDNFEITIRRDGYEAIELECKLFKVNNQGGGNYLARFRCESWEGSGKRTTWYESYRMSLSGQKLSMIK